jgi:RES domain-containing protein
LIRVWRIFKKKHPAFDGEGARVNGGRWNSPGRPAVYAAESPALAALEMLVHLQDVSALSHYRIVAADLDDGLVTKLDQGLLPEAWRDYPTPPEARALGDAWLDARTSVALEVPSAVIEGRNYVLNPHHPDIGKVTIGLPRPLELDARLLALVARTPRS